MRRFIMICILFSMICTLPGCLVSRDWWKQTLRQYNSDIKAASDDADHYFCSPQEPDFPKARN